MFMNCWLVCMYTYAMASQDLVCYASHETEGIRVLVVTNQSTHQLSLSDEGEVT